MFYIKIDARERDLIGLVKEKLGESEQITLVVEALDVGDIIFAEDDKELLVIERKKVPDLAASIVDGRYKEQSYRLDGYPVHNHNIVYMIEGNLSQSRMSKDTLNSSLFSINYVKGFSVWKTNNLPDSAEFLVNSIRYLAKGISKTAYYKNTDDPSDSAAHQGMSTSEKDYVSVVKTAKKENITPNNIGEIMLCQIPGISATTALAIMQHFSCMVNLIADLQEKGEECLHEVQVPSTKGASRKLNKTCIANLIKYLV